MSGVFPPGTRPDEWRTLGDHQRRIRALEAVPPGGSSEGCGVPCPPWTVDYDTGEVVGTTDTGFDGFTHPPPLSLEIVATGDIYGPVGGFGGAVPLVIKAQTDGDSSTVAGIYNEVTVGGGSVWGDYTKLQIDGEGGTVYAHQTTYQQTDPAHSGSYYVHADYLESWGGGTVFWADILLTVYESSSSTTGINGTVTAGTLGEGSGGTTLFAQGQVTDKSNGGLAGGIILDVQQLDADPESNLAQSHGIRVDVSGGARGDWPNNSPYAYAARLMGAPTVVDDVWVDGTDVFMPNLPTSDPGVSGQLWNSSGIVAVSP